MSGGNSLDLEHLFDHPDAFVAEEISNQWLEWKAAKSGAEARWKETLQFKFATSTRETINGNIGGLSQVSDDEDEEGGNGWSHSTHIPKISEIADNLSATYMETVYPHHDFFKYIGEDSEAVKAETRNKVESYLKAKHRAYDLRSVVQRIVDDFVDYGNCFAGVTYIRETVNNDRGKATGYVGPQVYRISPNDIVFNPLATDFAHAPKIIRSLKTLGELSRDAEEAPNLGYSKDAIQMAAKVRTTVRQVGAEDYDKYDQMLYDGYGTASQYFKSGHVEILEFFGDFYDISNDKFYKNHVITIMDRRFVLRNEPLNTWSGRPRIFHAGWRTRPDNLWAMGPLDNLIGLQFLINHLENARADAFDQMIQPTRIEIGDIENVDAESGKPGGKYIAATAEGDVKNLLPDTTVLSADNQIMMKMELMEQMAALPKHQLGIQTPGEKTFGEVRHLAQASSKVFKNKIIQLERFLENLINSELEVAKNQSDIEDLVSTIGEDGVTEFLNITPEDLKSNGKLIPIGARHFDRKAQHVQNFQLMQQLISQDPLAIQHFSSVKMAKIYEEMMDLDTLGVVTPYIRISEQAEAQKLQNAALTQIESEDTVPVGDEDEPDELEEDVNAEQQVQQ